MRAVGARSRPVGPIMARSSEASLGLFFITSLSILAPLAETISSTPLSNSFASLKARCVFAAFTNVFVSVPAFARNSCVLLQVIQPLR